VNENRREVAGGNRSDAVCLLRFLVWAQREAEEALSCPEAARSLVQAGLLIRLKYQINEDELFEDSSAFRSGSPDTT